MPLYEEKMICPLAVRFTQEHIRPIFQNGMELERTISEIKTKPGSGSYDVILDTPFHAIEIVRWHKRDLSAEEPEGIHWKAPGAAPRVSSERRPGRRPRAAQCPK